VGIGVMRDSKLKLKDQRPRTHKGERGKGISKEREVDRRREVCEWKEWFPDDPATIKCAPGHSEDGQRW